MDYASIYSRAYQESNYRMGNVRAARLWAFLSSCGGGVYVDVGCGRAESLDMAAEMGYTTLGFEIVKELAERGDVMLIDGIASMPHVQCDVLTCLDVLEHLEEPDVVVAVQKLASLNFKTAMISVAWFADRFGAKLGLDPLHVTLRPPEWWYDLLTLHFHSDQVSMELTGRDTAYFVIRRTES